MGIEYFVPRPPEVWAMPLWSEASLEERMAQLRQFPGISKVMVEALPGDRYLLIIEPFAGCGERMTMESGWESEQWLVAVLTHSDSWSNPRTAEVKMVNTHTLNRVYRPASVEETV